MSVDVSTANIARVLLQNLPRFITTFKSNFEKLTFARKSPILIDDNLVGLSQISLKIYKSKLDMEFALLPHNNTAGSFAPGTTLPSIHAYTIFVDVATKNKTIYK